MMTLDPEGVFRSGQLRICALCLGDIRKDDSCTYVENEISCIDCAEAADLALQEDETDLDEWQWEGGGLDDDDDF